METGCCETHIGIYHSSLMHLPHYSSPPLRHSANRCLAHASASPRPIALTSGIGVLVILPNSSICFICRRVGSYRLHSPSSGRLAAEWLLHCNGGSFPSPSPVPSPAGRRLGESSTAAPSGGAGSVIGQSCLGLSSVSSSVNGAAQASLFVRNSGSPKRSFTVAGIDDSSNWLVLNGPCFGA